ncbi:hypothetical protein QJS04_geneDACA015522 [Acorus gramineus]|uniref:Transcription factor 25 n=1 Tax=Acorus gramineus TaxID=55184 RepID=A0AAV9AUE9_ACOGR|nr:hypothetical protein QJS04_geneDACA024185 [Acorus gramineus]KAK1267743.1 hypothetical protein QJS04_geneDACA015522 [Acorus gramineus]
MSTRYLRKVLREQEQLQQQQSLVDAGPEPDEEDEEEGDVGPSRNLFDLLNDDDDQEVEEEVVNEKSSDFVEEKPSVLANPSKVVSSAGGKSKKKKQKKKNRDDGNSMKDRSEESIDAILEELAIDTKTINGVSSLLAVDPKFLKAEDELRRIFGSKIVRSFENDRNGGSSRQVRGGRRMTLSLRKTMLVSASVNWPKWEGDLSMELLETKGGVNYFRYVHSPSYSQAQRIFEAAKEAHDINVVAGVLMYYPYHIETLLTIADMYKFSGEHQHSADTIAKCLFALECAWHPLFSPVQGNCRLKYTHETNKPLFTALSSHMQNIERRGCHRSALEVCKLLLALDDDDPMGAIFSIDYFALRAEEYTWLERFVEEYKSDASICLFPNFSYSLAICQFYLERDAASKGLVLEDDKSSSTDLMKQALMLHPLVLKRLVEKTPLKDSVWTKILKHPFFGSAQAGSPSLDHLIKIYVERNYVLYRYPDLQNFLKEAAHSVTELLNINSTEVKDWACVSKEVFPSDKNEYSHLQISDFSDTVPTIPPDDLRQFMVHPPREVVGRNPGLVFLESLLPWIDYGAHEHGHQDDHDQVDQ